MAFFRESVIEDSDENKIYERKPLITKDGELTPEFHNNLNDIFEDEHDDSSKQGSSVPSEIDGKKLDLEKITKGVKIYEVKFYIIIIIIIHEPSRRALINFIYLLPNVRKNLILNYLRRVMLNPTPVPKLNVFYHTLPYPTLP